MADDIKTFDTPDFIIKVNHSLCSSCGSCVSLAPNIFELNKDMKSQVKKNPITNKDELTTAVNVCPSQAITAIDKKTGKNL